MSEEEEEAPASALGPTERLCSGGKRRRKPGHGTRAPNRPDARGPPVFSEVAARRPPPLSIHPDPDKRENVSVE